MKVLMINGQNHRGSTYHIGRILAEKLAAPKNIREIFLPRDFGEFCCGCNNCFMKSEEKCPHYKKLKPITELIDMADVIIFTTPTYVFHSSGQMKTLLDHYGWRWMVHRPDERMFGKQAAVISTAAGMGTKSAVKDIADSCFFWGIPKIYKFGMSVHAVSWDSVSESARQKAERETDKIAAQIKSFKRRKYVPLKTKGLFYVMRMLFGKGLFPNDKPYWEEKGWLGAERPWKRGIL